MSDGPNSTNVPAPQRPALRRRAPNGGALGPTLARLLIYALTALSLVFSALQAGTAQTLPVPALAAQSPLVGTWKLQGARVSMHIEFKPDGTYQAIGRTGVLNGKWAVLEGARLSTWADDSRPPRINKFALNDDWLVIVDDRGHFHKHRRVP